MKKSLLALMTVCLSQLSLAQINSNDKNVINMKLNAGIITKKIKETKSFYTEKLGFGVTFENEFYLLLHTPNKEGEISFLLPKHPSQQPLFHAPFNGKGIYLTIEVENIDEVYQHLKKKGVKIEIDLRDEPWGDRHFAIQDPNGIGIDMVRYAPVQED